MTTLSLYGRGRGGKIFFFVGIEVEDLCPDGGPWGRLSIAIAHRGARADEEFA